MYQSRTMTDNENKVEQSSEQLRQALEMLTTDQLRFIVARQEYATDKEAAEAIGIKPNTVSQWKHKGAPIDEAVRLMAADGLVTAQVIRRKALAKAMAVKVSGLDDDKPEVRQRASTEIIEWEMGKADQPVKHSGEIQVNDDRVSEALRILHAGGNSGDSGGG